MLKFISGRKRMIPFSRPLPHFLFGQQHSGTCHEVGHVWHPSCIYCFLEVFYYVYVGALKLYGPLYLISDLIRRRHPREVLLHTLPHLLRSSLFLAVSGGGFIGFFCLVRRLIGRFYHYLAAYAPAFLAAVCAILIERKSRRGLLAGYVSSLAVETLYRMLKFRGLISPVPYGEVILFSAASAVLLPAYRSTEGLHDAVGSILSVLFHPRFPKGVTRLVDGMIQGPVTMWRYAGYMVAKIALLSLWCYGVGYMTQVAVGLVSSGTKVFKQWPKLKRVLLNWYNVKFGAFLAFHIGGFKALEILLSMLPVSRNVRLMIAGLVAGLSMATIRSSSLSLYAATKAIEVVYSKAVKRGWARSYYYTDVVLYSLSAALLLHAAVFEAHNMRRSYWLFLSRLTGGRSSQLNWNEIDIFGTQASKRTRTEKERRRNASGEAGEEDL